MHVCMHVCMYACMHVCMYACMYAVDMLYSTKLQTFPFLAPWFVAPRTTPGSLYVRPNRRDNPEDRSHARRTDGRTAVCPRSFAPCKKGAVRKHKNEVTVNSLTDPFCKQPCQTKTHGLIVPCLSFCCHPWNEFSSFVFHAFCPSIRDLLLSYTIPRYDSQYFYHDYSCHDEKESSRPDCARK